MDSYPLNTHEALGDLTDPRSGTPAHDLSETLVVARDYNPALRFRVPRHADSL